MASAGLRRRSTALTTLSTRESTRAIFADNGANEVIIRMAVRSAIDIYGENVRTLGTIISPAFGEVMKCVFLFDRAIRTAG